MPSVVVVGGGIAGLGCAWHLARADCDVVVLERESVAGGRVRSVRHGEFSIELGAQFLASGYRHVRALVAELGLEDALRPLAVTSNAVLREGRLHPGDYDGLGALARSRLVSLGTKLRLPRLLFELWRRRTDLDPYHPERAAALDGGESLARFAERMAGAEARDYVVGPAISSTFDAEIEELSGTFFLLALAFVRRGFRLLALDGGLGRLTAALAARVPTRTHCQVVAVETDARAARVRLRRNGREERLRADAVVVAVPAPVAAEICPSLAAPEREFLASVRYARGMLAHLMLPKRPETLPFYGVGFPRPEGLDLYGLAVDHWKPGAAPDGAGLLNAAFTEAAAARLWDAPDAAVAEHAVDTLARTPIGRLEPSGHAIVRWPLLLPKFAPGYLPRLAAFLERPERTPRLAFAGDYLVGPYTEMALVSGMRAAAEILRELEVAA